MKKIAIIGAGISGLSIAHFLSNRFDVTVFEKESNPGGLIRCEKVKGSLFHTCGGHVFNSKRQDVLDWFWSKFQREDEFTKTDRNSCVFMDKNGTSLEYDVIPYPIENHIYILDEVTQKAFYEDLEEIDNEKGMNAKLTDYASFGNFLRWRFGKTLYELYFRPYNEKVWRRDLNTVPMSWMEGKLPMPTTQEMRNNNANKVKEKAFVHSTFWYEKRDGSQYIANKLAEGLNIIYNTTIKSIFYKKGKWIICGAEYDKVIYCGNVKEMIKMINGVDIESFIDPIDALEYHGTTTVFCEIDKNPYSWIYMPSHSHESHRIICTGNFSKTNNDSSIPDGRITATIEFTDEIRQKDVLENLTKIPLHPKYLAHKYNQYTYPIQNTNTRNLISKLKSKLEMSGFYFTGRFANWEYYNMDIAIGASLDLSKKIK